MSSTVDVEKARRRPVGLATLFVTSGVLHFVAERFYTSIVPDSLPNPKLLVQVSGVAEIAGGVGLLVPKARRAAGLGLLALLVAVFPANINMALRPERWPQIPRWALWARLPLQFVAMRWVKRAALDAA